MRELYTNSRNPRLDSLFDNVRHFDECVKVVELAGLCHDLGHGPYSHLFDNDFLPRVTRHGESFRHHPHAKHEARSVMLLEHLVDTHNLDWDREYIRHVGSIITGEKPAISESSSLTPRFLYDVVANQQHGIDTDKWDYLSRDVYNLGLSGTGFDHRRLMKFAKVVNDDITFHRKEIFNVYHMFLTRFQLHRTCYNHPAALSIDAMIADAFLHADESLGLSNAIQAPDDFLRLNDSLLCQIEYSKDPKLNTARHIVRRIRYRKLYRLVDEYLLPSGFGCTVTEQDITTCQDASCYGVDLKPCDIIISCVTLNFGKHDQNPVDSVLFFRDWNDQCPVRMPSSKVSYVLPAQFEERIMRVYLRREFDTAAEQLRAVAAAKYAFRRCIQKYNLGTPLLSPALGAGSPRAPAGTAGTVDNSSSDRTFHQDVGREIKCRRV